MRNYLYDYFDPPPDDDFHTDPRMTANDYFSFASKNYKTRGDVNTWNGYNPNISDIMQNGQFFDNPALNYDNPKQAELREWHPNARETANMYTSDFLTNAGMDKYGAQKLSRQVWGGDATQTPMGFGLADLGGVGTALWANEAPKYAVDAYHDVGETFGAGNQYASEGEYGNALKSYGLGTGQAILGTAALLPFIGPEARAVSQAVGKTVKDLGRNVSHYGYYSAADEVLKNAQRKKGNAQAWINEFKKGGVPNSELEWRKLNEYLASKPNQEVTKEELQNHLSQYPIRLHEEVHTSTGTHPDYLRDTERESVWESANNGDFDDQFKIEPDTEDADNPFALYIDGEKLDAYASEDEALVAGREKIGEMYSKDVDNMSDSELLERYDTNMPERTSRYVNNNDTRPKGGDDFQENVLNLNVQDYDNLNNKSQFLKYGGVHPDQPYKYPLGWTLTERYRNLPTGEKMLVAHELQSKMGQAISGQKKPLTQEQIDKFYEKSNVLQTKENELMGSTIQTRIGEKDFRYYDVSEIKDLNVRNRIDQLLNRIEGADFFIKMDEDEINKLKSDVEKHQNLIHTNPNYAGYIEEFNKDIQRRTERIQRLQTEKEKDQVDFQNLIKEHSLENKIKLLPPDIGLDKYQKTREALYNIHREKDEINSRLESNKHINANEVLKAPIVDSNSGMDPLIKRALHQAAEDDLDVFAVSDADRLYRRWGDEGTASLYPSEDVTNNGKVTGKISDIMLKLARQHDPQAQLEKFYPAGKSFLDEPVTYDPERLPIYAKKIPNHPNAIADILNNNENADLPLSFVDETGDKNSMLGPREFIEAYKINEPISHIGTDFTNLKHSRSLHDTFSKSYDKPQQVLKEDRRPVYTLRNAYDMVQGGNLYFSTKERAEEAMKHINEMFGKREKEGALKYIQKWEEKNGNPYFGIRLTPEMKESILKNGFSLFALMPLLYDVFGSDPANALTQDSGSHPFRGGWGPKWGQTQPDNALSYQNQF